MKKPSGAVIGAFVTVVAALIGAAATLVAAAWSNSEPPQTQAESGTRAPVSAPASAKASKTPGIVELSACVIGRWAVVSESYTLTLSAVSDTSFRFAGSGAIYTFATGGTGFKDYGTSDDVDTVVDGKEITLRFSGASSFKWKSGTKRGHLNLERVEDSDGSVIAYDSQGKQLDRSRVWVNDADFDTTCDSSRLTLGSKTLRRL